MSPYNAEVLRPKGFTVWFTGLPCSGKTTLSDLVEKELRMAGHVVEHLDGDIVRKELSRDLSFSKDDRMSNIERVAFVASLLSRNGVATIVSFVSPYREMRDKARAKISDFVEVHVRCPLAVCESRDVKGMYRLAREGKIPQFTGISDPYEDPLSPEVVVDTDKQDIRSCADKLLKFLESRGYLFPIDPFPGDELLARAFKLAAYHHRGQNRKGGDLPYISHPIAVARMLQETGHARETVAAGLLHDVLEDTGCDLEEMEKRAGATATAIVRQLTERDKAVPWKRRKDDYLRGLTIADKEALSVCCADKIHNIESLLDGARAGGADFLSLFAGSFQEMITNYREIYDIIRSRHPSCPLLPRYAASLESAAQIR